MMVAGWAEEENSAQRLENAQKGIAEASWPRKPDNRLSPLSGKMKDTQEITPRFYGQDKEFRTKVWGDSEKEANQASSLSWQGPTGRRWEEARWNQTGDWAEQETRNEKFQPAAESGVARILAYRDLSLKAAPAWSSRPAPFAQGGDASLRMYEGRLTRVRKQVNQEEKSLRDLGGDQQEKFSPAEVEKILAKPVEEWRGTVTEQSATASLPSTGGN